MFQRGLLIATLREPDAIYYLLNRGPGGITIHDPRQLTKACLGGRQINPKHWFRVPRSGIGRDVVGPTLYCCGVCLRDESRLRWNGELLADEEEL